jgi:hypothetical protein
MNQPMPSSGIRLIAICRNDERSRTKRVAQSRYRAGDRDAPYRTRQRPWHISPGR